MNIHWNKYLLVRVTSGVSLVLLWAGRMLEHDCFVLDRSSRGWAESPIEVHVHLFGLSACISTYSPTLLFVLQKCVISSHRIFPDRDDVTTWGILLVEMCLIYTNITDIELDNVEAATMNTGSYLEREWSERGWITQQGHRPALISSASSCIKPSHYFQCSIKSIADVKILSVQLYMYCKNT